MSAFVPEKYRVLIVDDEEDLAEIIQEELQDYGFHVELATSGNSAFQKVQESAFDLVISDIKMPDGDGCELLENIRKLHPSSPVVMLMTGFSQYSEDDLIARGAAALLEKPIDVESIYETLKDHFQSKAS